MSAAYIYDAIRTPFGKHGGALAATRPDDLAAHVVRTLAERSPKLDPALIGDVVFGNANSAGETNRDVARMAALLAGLPTSVTGTTVDRLCGSSMDATMHASRMIETGDAEIVLAGGVESMSRAPWVLPKPERAYPPGNAELYTTTLGWRMVNPEMPSAWTISLGEACDRLAAEYGISREAQDEFALRSHRRAAAAWDDGFYDWVVPVPGVELARDEGIRADSTIEKLASLPPVFGESGTITAGNASPLNDGASALMLGSEQAGSELGREPIARIAGRGAAGVDPDRFGIGPVEAARISLERAGVGWADLKAFELNEAFASQSLACFADWPELDPEIANVNGGAIAIGHPLGASGIRIIATLAHELRRRGGGYGMAAICIGVGQGLALVIEAQ